MIRILSEGDTTAWHPSARHCAAEHAAFSMQRRFYVLVLGVRHTISVSANKNLEADMAELRRGLLCLSG